MSAQLQAALNAFKELLRAEEAVERKRQALGDAMIKLQREDMISYVKQSNEILHNRGHELEVNNVEEAAAE